MIHHLLPSDFLKIKRKGLWFLAWLGPIGVVALQMVNYGYRKDYLLQQSDNDWQYYLLNIHSFVPIAFILGIAILTSFIASIENENHSWKQLLSLPVSKIQIYLSKFLLLACLLFFSSILLLIFTFLYGLYLDFDDAIPYVELITYSFYPYFAALPVLTLQLWIATVNQNQGVPMTTGIIGTIFAYIWPILPDWMIWKWPSLVNKWDEPLINVCLGVSVGCLFLILGAIHFSSKDVK